MHPARTPTKIVAAWHSLSHPPPFVLQITVGSDCDQMKNACSPEMWHFDGKFEGCDHVQSVKSGIYGLFSQEMVVFAIGD